MRYAFHYVANVEPPVGVDSRTFAGAFLFGMAMFGTLFLGVVLAIFLTLGTVRGDAERALLQPLVVRPIGRSSLLVARFLGAAAVCVPYVLILYFVGMLLTGLEGSWWPDRIATPGLELAGGVVIVAALSLLGSVFLSSIANGIAIFMIFGAGLVAGLLGNIGHVLNSPGLIHAAKIAAWAIPFEALYGRAPLDHGEDIRADGLPAATRTTRGAEQGDWLRLWRRRRARRALLPQPPARSAAHLSETDLTARRRQTYAELRSRVRRTGWEEKPHSSHPSRPNLPGSGHVRRRRVWGTVPQTWATETWASETRRLLRRGRRLRRRDRGSLRASCRRCARAGT